MTPFGSVEWLHEQLDKLEEHERRAVCNHEWEFLPREPGESYTGYCERCSRCGEIVQVVQ